MSTDNAEKGPSTQLSRARGLLAGREWAESGRSIAAVEAVVDYVEELGDPDFDGDEAAAFEMLIDEVGEDDEEFFTALASDDVDYIAGFFDGVRNIFNEWDSKR